MIRALIFDFYDTLVYRDVKETNRTRGEIAALFGLDLERLNALWRRDRDARMLGQIATLEEHLARMLRELGVEASSDQIGVAARLERAGQRSAVHSYPNTIPVLRRLRHLGYKLGLLSNSSDAAQEPIGSLGFRDLFDDVVLSHEVGLLKPDPAIYHLACERLGVEPRECAFIADGGFGELDAAHDAGMLAVKIEQADQSTDYGSSNYHDLHLREVAELVMIAESWLAADTVGG